MTPHPSHAFGPWRCVRCGCARNSVTAAAECPCVPVVLSDVQDEAFARAFEEPET